MRAYDGTMAFLDERAAFVTMRARPCSIGVGLVADV
jgi:hypothetical protein